jgi:hypothetical protein
MAKSKTTKPTKQQISSIDVEARTNKLTRDAQSAIALREKLNIRFTQDEILRIQKAAEQSKKRVMPMLRKWVLDSLEAFETEQLGGRIPNATTPLKSNTASLYVRENLDPQSENLYDRPPAMQSIETRLSALEYLMAQIAAQLSKEDRS